MNTNKKWLVAPYGIWIIGFVILPLILICFYGLSDTSGQFTLDNALSILDPVHRDALWLSLKLSFLTTGICLLLAYPLALILNHLKLGRNSFIVMVFVLPMWMNFMLRTLAWMLLLSNNGVINSLLNMLNLPNINILYTPTAVVLGMVYDFLPFMILPIYNSVVRIDNNVIEAARDLGANNVTVFRKILLPLTKPGIISGITMVFIPALTSFVVSDLLGGGKVLLIGNVIEQEFSLSMNWNQGSGLSLVLMIFILASMAFMQRYSEEDEGVALW